MQQQQKYEWVSVREYCKRKNIKSPQVVYNHIAMGKLKKGIEWREVVTEVTRKQLRYEI